MSVAPTKGLTVKEIDVAKVRAAILSLQNSGKSEYAQVVWDLLDNYVSQRPQPIVMRQDGPQFTKRARTPQMEFPPVRGASAWDGFPSCEVTKYMGGGAPCTTPAIGHLNTKSGMSYPMCSTHGENLNSAGYADWVQTFFGDENSAADVAALAVAMEEKASEREPETLHCLVSTLYVNAPELHGKCARPATGELLNTKTGIATDGCTLCGSEFASKHKRRGFVFTLYSDISQED